MTNNPSDSYPVQFSVEYPEGERDRGSALVRIVLAIPIMIVAGLVSGSISLPHDPNPIADLEAGLMGAGPSIAVALMILFRQKYPRWWFDFGLALLRFNARVWTYVALLRDESPSTDEHQAVRLDVPYPDATGLNRVLPLFKWLLAIPHYVVLSLLGIVATVMAVISWIAILVTGQQPKWAFEFLEGMMRWGSRVIAYAFLLTTDRYPPFSLSA